MSDPDGGADTAWYRNKLFTLTMKLSLAFLVVLVAVSLILWAVGVGADWFSGVGQWAGAVAGVFAGIAALWIATTDRRIAKQQRDDDRTERAQEREAERQDEEDALAREASLVRVQAGAVVSQRDVSGWHRATGIRIDNRRVGRIFEVEVVSVVVRGEALTDLEPNSIYGLRLAPSDKDTHPKASLGYMTVRSDQALSIYMDQIRCGDDEPVEAVIRYTDERGYRWEVGTSGEARRVRASEA
ncbi:hypothetical protein ACXYTP_21440 [Tsukamurella ocularis]